MCLFQQSIQFRCLEILLADNCSSISSTPLPKYGFNSLSHIRVVTLHKKKNLTKPVPTLTKAPYQQIARFQAKVSAWCYIRARLDVKTSLAMRSVPNEGFEKKIVGSFAGHLITQMGSLDQHQSTELHYVESMRDPWFHFKNWRSPMPGISQGRWSPRLLWHRHVHRNARRGCDVHQGRSALALVKLSTDSTIHAVHISS